MAEHNHITMNTHTPITMPMLAESGCAMEDCEHEDECPTFDAVVCFECNAAVQGTTEPGDWGGAPASCTLFGIGVPPEQVAGLLSALTVPNRPDGSES